MHGIALLKWAASACALLFTVGAAGAAFAQAERYPDKPIKSEMARWAPLIQKLGIKGE